MTQDLWTVKRIVDWGKNYLTEKGIDSPRLTMELLLCDVLKLKRIDLYMNHEKPLNNIELKKLREFILRRADREPLQYIVGYTEFFGNTINVNPSVLIPRPETELLVKIASDFAKKQEGDKHTALDIGTGSGCIILSFAKLLPEWSCTAIDNSEEALTVAKQNAKKLAVKNVHFHNADIFVTPPRRKYTVVMSNPPYIGTTDMDALEPEVGKYEPKSSLTDGEDGLKYYKHFAEIFPQIIAKGGAFFMEIGYGQADSVRNMFRQKNININIENDYSGIPRIAWSTI